MTDYTVIQYVFYALGSFCFIVGSLIGLAAHLGVFEPDLPEPMASPRPGVVYVDGTPAIALIDGREADSPDT